MVPVNALCKNILNIKNAVIEDCNLYHSADGVKHIRIKAKANKWHENECLLCHKPCPLYDRHSSVPRDAGSILVEVEYQTHRIICPDRPQGIWLPKHPEYA